MVGYNDLDVDSVKRKIAMQMRKRVEILVDNGTEGFYDFHSNLAGLCAICATALKEVFETHGMNGRVMYGKFQGISNHAWYEDDMHIWDITATQFGGIKKRIIFMRKNREFARYLYQDGVEMPDFLSYNNWPIQQRPKKELIQKLV